MAKTAYDLKAKSQEYGFNLDQFLALPWGDALRFIMALLAALRSPAKTAAPLTHHECHECCVCAAECIECCTAHIKECCAHVHD